MNKGNNSNKLRNVITLIIILIPIWLIGINISLSKEIIFEKETATNLYPEAVLKIENCERTGNQFFTLHNDPQILVKPPKFKISSTMIEFAEPIPFDTSVQIYYAEKYQGLSEQKSIITTLQEGSSEIIIKLPSAVYTSLRYDIQIIGVSYEIKGIYVSELKKDNSSIYITLIISICIFILWVIGIRTGKMNILIGKIINLLKKANLSKIIIFISIVIIGVIATLIFDSKFISGDLQDMFVRKEYEKRYDQQLLYKNVKDFLIDGKVITTTSNDPWIYLDTSYVKMFKYIKLDIDLLSMNNNLAQIFYATKERGFNEVDSKYQTLKDGINYIRIPKDSYIGIRLDLTNIEDISFSIDYVELTNKFSPRIIDLLIIIFLNILWCGIWLIIFNKNSFKDWFINKKHNNTDKKDTNKNNYAINDTITINDTPPITTKDASTVLNTITDKVNNTNKKFLIAIFLLIILKLSLVMGNKMHPIPYAGHDDMLMYSRAVSISNGEWLGSYNNLILAKGAFFSIWLAFLNILSMPMLIGNEILYTASCLFLVWSINNIIINKKILLLIFAVLLFNPVTLGCSELLRIYRDGIFPALIIFVIAGIIGMFLKKDDDKEMLICSILSGISLSAAWHTREDTFWILPFVIVADIVIAIFLIIEKKYKDNIKKYIYLILPFIILFMSNLLISSVNNIKYGRFITNDYMSKDFQGAYGALTRVTHEKFDYYNPVPEEVRMKVYQISPSFNELRIYLDEGPLDKWKDEGKKNKWPLHDFYSWFMWALRDAVAACGYYENPQKAKEYYKRLAKEVNDACDAGLLPSRTSKRVTLASPFSREYIAPTIEYIKKTVLYVIKYDKIFYEKNYLIVDDELFSRIRDMEFYLNQLSWCVNNYVVLNGWAFDRSEDIDIEIINNLNQKVNSTIIKNNSMDVYNHFNNKYKTALKARFYVKFEINSDLTYYLNISNKKGEKLNLLIDNNLHGGSDSANIIYHIDRVYFPNKDNNNKIEKFKYIFSNFLLKISKKINPVMTLIAFLSLLILTFINLYRLFMKKEIYYFKEVIIIWGLLLVFFVRTVMIAYVSASSFHAINTLYLSSSYPIMIIFNCISICCLFSLIKKYIKIKK